MIFDFKKDRTIYLSVFPYELGLHSWRQQDHYILLMWPIPAFDPRKVWRLSTAGDLRALTLLQGLLSFTRTPVDEYP